MNWKDWYQLWNLWEQQKNADEAMALTKDQIDWEREKYYNPREPKMFAPPEQAKAYDQAAWAKYQGDLNTRTQLRKAFGQEGGIFESMARDFNAIRGHNPGEQWRTTEGFLPSQDQGWASMMADATGMGAEWDPNMFNTNEFWDPPKLATDAIASAEAQFEPDSGFYTPMGNQQGGDTGVPNRGGSDPKGEGPDVDVAPEGWDIMYADIYDIITQNPGISILELQQMFPQWDFSRGFTKEGHNLGGGMMMTNADGTEGFIYSPVQNAWVAVDKETIDGLINADNMLRSALGETWDFVKDNFEAAMMIGGAIYTGNWELAGAAFMEAMSKGGTEASAIQAIWDKIKNWWNSHFGDGGDTGTPPPPPNTGGDPDPDWTPTGPDGGSL